MNLPHPDFDTLIEYFYHWVEQEPDAVFLRQPNGANWKTLTFADVRKEAGKMTTALKGLGLEKGDHIALLSKNCYHWILADLAIMMGGFVSIPLYASLNKNQLEEVLTKSDAKAVFVGKLDAWGVKAEGVPEQTTIIRFPHYDGNARVDEGQDWNALIADKTPVEQNFIPDANSLWTILFTSGTTGSPKGVMHLHRTPTQIFKDERSTNWLGLFQYEKHQYFSYLPLNHVAERIAVESGAIVTGSTISFVESLTTFAQNLQDTQPTVFFAVPRIWTKFYLGVLSKMPQKRLAFLLKIPIVSGVVKKKLLWALGMSHAKVVGTGAAITAAYLKTWYRKLGIQLIEAYGMTEVCGSITNSPMKDCPADSVGKVIPGGELKIDPTSGEILMKSPYMMTGYYKEPAMTQKVLIDGWMHSGDKGTIDENGFLKVIGRVSDVFKTSKGQFVTPNPMEEILSKNDFIEQVCVVGLGIPQPIALVNLSEIGQLADKYAVEQSLTQSLESLNHTLSNYQKISTIIIDQQMWDQENEILTPTLKVRRTKIDECYREQYLGFHQQDKCIIRI